MTERHLSAQGDQREGRPKGQAPDRSRVSRRDASAENFSRFRAHRHLFRLEVQEDIERIFGVVTELIARRVHCDLCIDTIAAQDTLPFRERRGRYAPDARQIRLAVDTRCRGAEVGFAVLRAGHSRCGVVQPLRVRGGGCNDGEDRGEDKQPEPRASSTLSFCQSCRILQQQGRMFAAKSSVFRDSSRAVSAQPAMHRQWGASRQKCGECLPLVENPDPVHPLTFCIRQRLGVRQRPSITRHDKCPRWQYLSTSFFTVIAVVLASTRLSAMVSNYRWPLPPS